MSDLQRIRAMYEEGLLTREEFEAASQRLENATRDAGPVEDTAGSPEDSHAPSRAYRAGLRWAKLGTPGKVLIAAVLAAPLVLLMAAGGRFVTSMNEINDFADQYADLPYGIEGKIQPLYCRGTVEFALVLMLDHYGSDVDRAFAHMVQEVPDLGPRDAPGPGDREYEIAAALYPEAKLRVQRDDDWLSFVQDHSSAACAA